MLQTLAQHFQTRFSGVETPIQLFRQKKIADAIEAGLPSRKNENWHYTPLSSISSLTPNKTYADVNVSKSEIEKLRMGEVRLFAFVNGRFRQELSDSVSESGVRVTSLATMLMTRFDFIQDWVSSIHTTQKYNNDVFANLNSAYLEEGLVIEVEANIKAKPIQILNFITDGDVAIFTKVFVRLAPSADASILETHVGTGFNSVATYGQIAKNASLSYIRFGSSASIRIDEGHFELQRDAKLATTNLVLSPILNRHVLNIILKESGAEVTASGLSLLDHKQVSDNQINIEHIAPNCMSRQLYKSVLTGQSKSIFAGRIFIPKGSVGTDADQLNKNLILSRQAEADVKPQLEVHADDVKATHGAAIGRFDPEELFYLQSRGIPKDEALTLLANAFIDDVLNGISDHKVKSSIRAEFLNIFLSFQVEGLHGA